jgi:uncharacterized protein
MAETICHFEFMSNDPVKSRAFYSKIFSWEYQDMGMPGYTGIKTGAQLGGGLMAKPAEAPSPALNVYFYVESIEKTLGKVRAAGGNVIKEKTEIPGMGWWAMFMDPEGICLGIFEEMKK